MKIVNKLLVLMILVSIFACGGNPKYNEVKGYYTKLIEVQAEYVEGLRTSSSSEAAITVITRYDGQMLALVETMNNLIKKFPELKDSNKIPNLLKKYILKKSEKLSEVSMRAKKEKARFKDNVSVQEALANMQILQLDKK